MKAVILIFAIALFSCNDQPSDAEKLIESEKQRLRKDSIDFSHQQQIEAARRELELATGEKDTLTNEERLEQAKDRFK